MHGQKKTDKSEAVKEKERKQKEAKLKEYRDGMAQIAARREAKLMDWETMGVIGDVLRVNPDVYTLWNLRKEIILLLLADESKNEDTINEDSKNEESKNVESKSKEFKNEDTVKLGENELRLTESCLKINPKSYGAWHHRKWILENCPGLDLKIELALCTKYLKLDSRNFHCWDYRRFVVSMLDLSPEEELSYTLVKIEEDFSNYSSWHYRSKLLPLIHGDPSGQKPIEEEVHLQELDLVQNAAFTDPNDSSAWYYLRWLVGELEPKLDVIVAFVSSGSEKLYVGFNRNASLDRVRVECPGASRWRTVDSFKDGALWLADLDTDSSTLKVDVVLQSHTKSVTLTESEGFLWQANPQFDPTISEKMKAVLKEQLDSCNQLLDLEPDTKWPLLTSVVFMKAIDATVYQDDIKKRLESLKKCDPYRINYYNDLMNKYLIEEKLQANPSENFSLANLNLKSLHHSQYLSRVVNLDLSNNRLEKSLPKIVHAVSCKHLNLDSNSLKSLKNLPRLSKLETISLADNEFECLDDLLAELDSFASLSLIILRNNPLTKRTLPTKEELRLRTKIEIVFK